MKEKGAGRVKPQKNLSWQQKNKNDSSLGLDGASRSYDDSLNEHENFNTPNMFKKSIKQHTFDSSQNLPNQKIFKCYVIWHLVRKYISSPTTCNTMKGILHRYNISNEKSRKHNSHLQGIVLKI